MVNIYSLERDGLIGEEIRHEYCVGFLVHKDSMSIVLGCRPVSSRVISHLEGHDSLL